MWVFTVLRLMCSSAAISAFVRPRAMVSSTCSSRSVSGSIGWAGEVVRLLPAKDDSRRRVMLGEAIRAATRGDSLISPSITRRLLSTFAGTGRAVPPAQPLDPLTEREEQVLLTIARGRTNAEIAGELHISLSTVKTHIGSLMAKLGARNRVEVAMWGYETGRLRE